MTAHITADPRRLPHGPGHAGVRRLYAQELFASLQSKGAEARDREYKERLAKHQPVSGTLLDWAVRKQWPVWLTAVVADSQPVNRTYAEDEIDSLGKKYSGLALGRKGA